LGFGEQTAQAREIACYRHLPISAVELCDAVARRAEAESEHGSELLIKVLLFVWVVLLLPWVLFAFLSPMAADGGKNWAAWLLMFFTWSYAPAVYGAFKLLTYSRKAVLLPLLSIGGMFLSDFLAR
jgi:hypothetical protein